jgi:hypothetical protein
MMDFNIPLSITDCPDKKNKVSELKPHNRLSGFNRLFTEQFTHSNRSHSFNWHMEVSLEYGVCYGTKQTLNQLKLHFLSFLITVE